MTTPQQQTVIKFAKKTEAVCEFLLDKMVVQMQQAGMSQTEIDLQMSQNTNAIQLNKLKQQALDIQQSVATLFVNPYDGIDNAIKNATTAPTQ